MSMRVAVVGAGAIGGLVAARLALAGTPVSVVARGATALAIRSHGLSLVQADGTAMRVHPTVAVDPAELGEQDMVVLAVKAYQLPAAAERLGPLLGPRTCVVPLVNGIPWWYSHGIGDWDIPSLDPEGCLRRAIAPQRIVGCTVHIGAEAPSPGRIRHIVNNRLILGELDGSDSSRLAALLDLLGGAGFAAQPTPRIRDAVWAKLWGNIAFNPLSVLTGATMAALCGDPGSRRVAHRMMDEARRIGTAYGAAFDGDIESRIAAAGRLGAFKTSMLQDFARGRPLELDAILGSVIELGRRAGIAAPTLETVLVLVALRQQTACR